MSRSQLMFWAITNPSVLEEGAAVDSELHLPALPAARAAAD